MLSARKKVLLVDDDEAVIEYLTIKLADEFELIATSSPEQALHLAREIAPDLVICDIDLQTGMDGGDISAALYAQPETKHIPLIYLTALVSPADLKASNNQLAGRAAISKQASIGQIVAKIRANIG